MVVIPWRGNIVFLNKMLPTSMSDRVNKLFGLQKAMSDFKGKGSIDKRIPGIK
jgi:hypothetical protein